MMSRRDQADKLRTLAQKQGIAQKEDVLTYRSLMQEKKSPAKIFLSILKGMLLLIVLGALAAGGYFFFENNKKDKAMIASLSEKSENLKNQVSALHEKTSAIEADVVKNVHENQELTKAVQGLHSTNKELQANYSKITQDKQAIEEKLASATNQIQAIEKTKQDLQVQTHVELSTLQAQIKDLRTSLSKAQEKLQAQATVNEPAPSASAQAKSEPVQLARTTVAAARETGELFASEGKILFVNQGLQFVIVNMGAKQGIKAGARLLVVRDNLPVETLKVIEVRPEVSACESKSTVLGLRVGDKVKVQ